MTYSRSPKVFENFIIRTALSGITHINPLIHRSMFFIDRCSYAEVEARLGKIRVLSPQESAVYLERQPGYEQVGFIKRKLGVLTVYFNPYEAYWPWFRFHTSQSSKKALWALYEDFPSLKVSSLEYAIDFFCDSPQSVNHLFYLLRRYMFFPYAQETFMEGGEFLGWNEPRTENAVYHIHLGENHAKIYERGNDKNGIEGREGWLHKNVNRVRLEFTFYRTFLVRNKIISLRSLVKNAKFHRICSRRIQFKNFKNPSPFPKTWENYTAEDEDGNSDCLMEEYFKAREGKIKNVRQYLEDNRMLNALKRRILDLMRNFDNDWKSFYDYKFAPPF
jgi:hypothetical protein